MQRYADINGDSGVVGYEIGDTDITVWFDGAAQSYTYSYAENPKYRFTKLKKTEKLFIR